MAPDLVIREPGTLHVRLLCWSGATSECARFSGEGHVASQKCVISTFTKDETIYRFVCAILLDFSDEWAV